MAEIVAIVCLMETLGIIQQEGIPRSDLKNSAIGGVQANLI
jgi:hypothetical protein